MMNQTMVKELFLSGLSDLPALQLPLFLFFLLIYLLTLIWNLLIIVLIVTDSHLHVPMYFFLGNLASLDICSSSVTAPRMLFDLLTQRRRISIPACMTQVFFFLFFVSSETFLLTVMSYDRYTAICHPLHYTQIMSWKVCVQLVSSVWCLSFVSSFIHSVSAINFTFCGSDIIESFFCELPHLLQISCSDISINILLIFLLGALSAGGPLILTFLSYVYIFKTVLKMQISENRSKVFTTCTPHLIVVFMFFGSAFFNYFQSNTNHQFHSNKVISVFYTMIIPLLNPLIYSLRNQDLRKALKVSISKIISRICHIVSNRNFND